MVGILEGRGLKFSNFAFKPVCKTQTNVSPKNPPRPSENTSPGHLNITLLNLSFLYMYWLIYTPFWRPPGPLSKAQCLSWCPEHAF